MVDVTLKTSKMLWGRAGGRCSLPECRLDLFIDDDESDNSSLVGEQCHIVAREDNGPRGDAAFPVAVRNTYSNLILLCRNHHKVIDDIPSGERKYPSEQLRKIKAEHEEWVRASLSLDTAAQENDENYAQIVDGWERRCHVPNWMAWSSHMLSNSQPTMSEELSDDLSDARRWLMNRIWPGTNQELEDNFHNFRMVLNDLYNIFISHSNNVGGRPITDKFYKIKQWDEVLYAKLGKEYDYHVDLVQDLMLELTRAANLICDTVRRDLFRGYRRDEGRLVVQSGPNMNFGWDEWVPTYTAEERKESTPFPGLEKFRTVRTTRDSSFAKA